jgi:integrase
MKALNKRRITEMTLQKARATDGRVLLIWDRVAPGLVLAVQPSGHKAFRFFYSVRGKARWVHLGLIYISDARRLGFKLRAAIAEGRDPALERQSANSITFADLAARYLEVSKKKNKSWKQADALVKKYLIPRWGKRDAKSITSADVSLMMSKIKAPISANQTIAAASAIFVWAMKPTQGLVIANPTKGIERNPTTARERTLSDSEIVSFWTEFERLDPIRCAALKTLLLTGQRKSEVACMRWEHVKDGWWDLPGKAVPALGWPGTKNGYSHKVWLPKAAQDIIDSLPITNGFVFGKPVTGLDAAMRDICKRLDCERATPHDLRRTHGTTITGLGFGTDAMNRIQNHREGGITSVYDRHDYAPENKKIMERVAQHIVAIAAGREDDNVVFAKFHGAEPA